MRQATIEEHEKEMSALVEDEGRIAKDMEARLSEVKEVREGGRGGSRDGAAVEVPVASVGDCVRRA